MCCYDTVENARSAYTGRTLDSLADTVDLQKHRLIIIDNNSCERTKKLLKTFNSFYPTVEVITLGENIGTAKAINLAWKKRQPGEHCIKMDNDVVIHHKGWVEELEEAISRDPLIGQVGLKRKDCIESPFRNDDYKSELFMLPHEPGQRWIIAEKVNHVIGTCVMHSEALLNKVGFLYQPKIYGFDDVLMSIRAKIAGFKSVFLPHIHIEHIDTGENLYQKEKEKIASESWKGYHEAVKSYYQNPSSIYYNPYDQV